MIFKNKFEFLIFSLFLILILIPITFAADESIAVEDSIEDNENIYFDSTIEEDGNGSYDNPYKYLMESRIVNNSNIYLANGEYEYVPDSGVYLLNNKVNVSFIGEDSQKTTVVCRDNNWLYSDTSLLINNLTLLNTNLFVNGSNVIMNNVIFKDSVANPIDGYNNSFGGSIYGISNSNIYLDNCSFINTTGEYGGAIYINGSNLVIQNSLFLNTTSYIYGGAIACEYGGVVTVNRTKFINTHANSDAGGAIYIVSSNLNAYSLNITDSSAEFGGVICALSSKTHVEGLYCENNTAKFNGGAVYVMYGDLTIIKSDFLNNCALNGGAIFVDNVSLNISNNNFIKNNASIYGSAIYSIFNQNPIFEGNEYVDNELFEINKLVFIPISEDTPLFVVDITWDGEFPSYYNLVDYGYVSPVKNQQTSGNCWAFTAMAVLESCILKAANITYDLSEENLKNVIELYSDYGWDKLTNDGGNKDMAVGYFSSWLGPVLESDDVFDDRGLLSYVFDSVLHIQNVVYLKRDGYLDNDEIKEAIMKYGAVGSSLYYVDDFLNENTNAYYVNQNVTTNHAVTIVGWNDTYSKDNFLITPPGDGAWIVKNSWSDNWGDNGFFYVSYYDDVLAKVGESETAYTFIFNDTVSYSKNYQYDIAGRNGYIYLSNYSTVYYKNIFTSTDDEFLAAVSTYFKEVTDWEVFVYVGDDLKSNKSGKSNPGYYTINLDDYVSLNKGDEFSIVFKITTGGIANIPTSPASILTRDIYTDNVSFYSHDGINWQDIYSKNSPSVASIKAFTVLGELDTIISLKVNGDEIVALVYDLEGNAIDRGRISFKINADEYNVTVNKGVASLTYSFSDNEYEIIASFSAVGYKNSTNKALVNSNTDFDIIIDSINYTDKLNVNIYLTKGEITDGNVSVLINNKIYSLNIGLNEINDILDAGEYEAVLLYNSFILKDTKFNVSKLNVDVSLVYNIDFNDVYINVTLNKSINATLTINGSYIINITDGKANFTLYNLEHGNYNFTVLFDSINYQSNPQNLEFNINVYKTEIIANNLETKYGEIGLYEVRLTTSDGNIIAGKTITINIGNINYTNITDNEGIAYFALDLNASEYEATISFGGDENYAKSRGNYNITVQKADIDASLQISYNATNTIFNIPFTKNINGTLTFTFLDTPYVVDIVDGNANLVLGSFRGNLEANVEFENENYKSLNKIFTFSIILKEDINISFTYNVKYGENIIVTLTDGATGNVIFTVNNNNYTSKIINSKATISVLNLNVGEYNIAINYSGDDNYNAKILNSNMFVNKMSTKLTAPSSITISTVNNKYTTFVLKDENNRLISNKKVSIVFDGVSYTKSTNAKGEVSIILTAKSTGSKILTVKFTGDSNYYQSSIQTKVKVNKEKTTLNVPAKTYKKSAKSKKLQITLKDTSKRSVKNVKITVKVKGKTYSAKTNSKGIATINLKITKKGTFKANVKFAGNNYYAAISKTVKIKIKK